MSTDAKWTLGTGVALLVAALAVFTMMSGHFDRRFDSIEARLNSIESRLLSIEEHLRAAPAPALPEHP